VASLEIVAEPELNAFGPTQEYVAPPEAVKAMVCPVQ
jgi:hypothetical protein